MGSKAELEKGRSRARGRRENSSGSGAEVGAVCGEKNRRDKGAGDTLTACGAKAIVARGTEVTATPNHCMFAQALTTMGVALRAQ